MMGTSSFFSPYILVARNKKKVTMNKLYSYAGKLQRVDLTKEQITEEKLDKETGKPLPDTLRRFDLEHTIPELWER